MKWGIRRARQNKSSANNPRKKSSKKEARAYESKVFTDKYGKIHKKYDPDIQDTIKKIVKVNTQDISQNGYKNIRDLIELQEIDMRVINDVIASQQINDDLFLSSYNMNNW